MSPSVIGPSIGDMLRTPPANPLTIETAARLGGTQQAVPPGHFSGQGGEYVFPIAERVGGSTWMFEIGFLTEAGGTFGVSSAIVIQSNPLSFAVAETTFVGGTLGAGASRTISITQFPSMTDLNSLDGRGTEIGANIPIPGTPAFVGGEHRVAHTGPGQPDYHGWSLIFGGGISVAMPGQVQNSHTVVHQDAMGILGTLANFLPVVGQIRQIRRLNEHISNTSPSTTNCPD